jgi:hypothetical protein
MMNKIGLGVAAAALTTLLVPLTANAEPGQTADITGWIEEMGQPTDEVFGDASLVRTDNGITMTYHSTGLPAGEAVTLWWIIFEDGALVSAQFAAGHVIGNDGVGNFAGHLAEGDTSGCFLPADQFPCQGLSDAQNAEVWLLARVHGPADPGRTSTQIHTSETTGENLAADLCGPVLCQVQRAVFGPAE